MSKSPVYWVIITDGALPDEDTPGSLADAVAGLRRGQVKAAMLVLRQDGDDPVSPVARRALAEVPARLGGVLRELAGQPRRSARRLPSSRGCGARRSPQPRGQRGGRRPTRPLAPLSIPPGSGGRLIARTSARRAGRLVIRAIARRGPGFALHHGGPHRIDLGRNRCCRGPSPAGWVKTDRGVAAVIMPAAGDQASASEPPALRGRMEKDVVQRALGYAFLPRARACYLTRAIKTAADFQLKGRLRLELHLERGEMMAAVVRRSTLGRPDIEACLREAAFAVEVPRALHSDAPVIAALNLVFRPRTEAKVPGASASDDAIDRILGPLPPPSDPLELLIEETEATTRRHQHPGSRRLDREPKNRL